MRRFNVTGLCVPGKHYMVDIGVKLAQIREMVDRGEYFIINRARQYGKTTTLSLLKKMLKDEYIVTSISFEGLGDESFVSSAAFCRVFLTLIFEALEFINVPDKYKKSWLNDDVIDFKGLSSHITMMCKPAEVNFGKKLVLMINEVDKTSNNRTCLHFLGMLRDKYLKREQNEDHTFHSVILAGVYDIKNIKLKMINEGAYAPMPTENIIFNSPWNIAADFKIDMSFGPSEITSILAEYESDYKTGMDVPAISDRICGYINKKCFTTGYLLTFDFRKGVNKRPCAEWVSYDGKRIFDVVV